ncbi:MAG: chemotaxis protein CheA [Minwuia sp.]|uniref:chemotaxis protein CheA n=1 Tax=Minwuia sp. TaxID=2493630 RepID=UPI003A837F3B
MDDLIVDFIEETMESLAEVELDLVGLEQNPDQPGTIDQLFRIVHTIKGTCSFINLERLGQVAHAAENLLGLVRDGTIRPDPAVITAVLEAMDQIRIFLDAIQADGKEPEVDVSNLIARLDKVAEDAQGGGSADAEAEAEAETDDDGAEADEMEETAAEDEAEEAPARGLEVVETAEGDGPETVEEASNPLVATLADILASGKTASEALDSLRGDDEPVAPKAAPAPAPATKPVEAAADSEPAQDAAETASASTPARGGVQGLRVSVDLIEQLMTLVSELVLTRNQLMQLVRNESDSVFNIPFQRLSQVTSELQEGVMKTRMQPIGNAWNKLPRIVRDLGIELGKKIELEMDGADTELDRQVLDMIKDPLTHMVRNSADHGIETPAIRSSKGKNETGTIRLSARHEGGHIVIELSDDGAGLNADAIRKRIVERNLVGAAEAEAMDDRQLHRYIFEPGFSTAEAVSKVSGRGVGMDVVRTNIEKIGGSIDLEFGPRSRHQAEDQDPADAGHRLRADRRMRRREVRHPADLDP